MYVLTSKGEMQGCIYSGEKIQSLRVVQRWSNKEDSKECSPLCGLQTSAAVFPECGGKPETSEIFTVGDNFEQNNFSSRG